MIHSLAGGVIDNLDFRNFAKVRIVEGEQKGAVFWYVFDMVELEEGNTVIVPVGLKNVETKGVVEKIEYNVSKQVAPVPAKRAKKIYRIV